MLGITRKRTSPYRPQANGKIPCFHRTLGDGCVSPLASFLLRLASMQRAFRNVRRWLVPRYEPPRPQSWENASSDPYDLQAKCNPYEQQRD